MSNIGGVIKSIRDIFRKDPGLSGDAQRIEQLGWMIFLKLFDDKDKEKELLDLKYKSAIPIQLQWRTWAENDEGITGDELILFVNNTLFPQLKELPVTADNRLGIIIRNIFDGTNNYMKSGTTFRQAINKLNEIDFNSSKEHHIFNAIYEDILQGLATKKDTGEFYTPRAVTQFIIDMVNPQLGEKLKDPANGTGGFLVCAIEHLRKQVNNVADLKILQETITGTELKPLPFMLSVINLIIHDIEVPQIENGDSLSRELTSIKQADRVDVIVTNPPFGGVVGDGMETNFPLNFRTKESADLFLILFIQLLKNGGRAGIVLPDGSLTGEGVKARVRQKLLEDCNVHTIIRLPNSVFKPYATVATNLIFFEKGKSTKEIWFYQHKYLEGVKSYSKTNPIRIEEFQPIKDWWSNRIETDFAWKVSIDTIIKRGYDLDIKNPKSKQEENLKSSIHVIDELKNDLLDIHSEIDDILSTLTVVEDYEIKTIDQICNLTKGNTGIKKAIEGEYPLVVTSEVRSSHNSYQFDTEAVCIPLVSSSGHGHASLKRLHYQSGKFALGTILVAAVPKENSNISARYLYYYLNNFKDEILVPLMKGMANVSLSIEKIKTVKVFVPPVEKQNELINLMEKCENVRKILNKANDDSESMIKIALDEAFNN